MKSPAGVTFVGGEEMYALAQAEVKALQDEGCDYIICLGHLGIDDETAATKNRSVDLLGKVTGIDVFIDGHSHSTLEAVREATGGSGKVGGTYLTSTGTKLASVGRVILDGESRRRWSWPPRGHRPPPGRHPWSPAKPWRR